MIFECRAYLLKPGRADDFWAAQEACNGPEVFSAILGHNLFYASSASGEGTQIVHLYRFPDLLAWQQVYADYYRRQSPDYFAQARPKMLEQENAFFRLADLPGWPGFGGWRMAATGQAPETGCWWKPRSTSHPAA